jgi:sugar phosphate isomerase/epimerase
MTTKAKYDGLAITRRGALLTGTGALLAAAYARESTFGGVALGIQSRSFKDRPLDEAIAAISRIGFGTCELSGVHVEPKVPAGGLRQWRLTVPLDLFATAGEKFRQAGIEPQFLTYNLSATATEAEIARGFEMAHALGAKAISSSTKLNVVPAIDAAAKRYKMRAGLHNHSLVKPGEITTPEDFATALRGRSEFITITLDIGHLVAAGFDPVLWLRQHYHEVISLHIKDRKKNQGPAVPFGEGDTPIDEVLRFTRQKARNIPALIEYEYDAKDNAAEIRNCFDYCKKVLLS